MTWLAKRTGVATVTVYSYAAGVRKPTSAWLSLVAEALGVPLSLLVRSEERQEVA